MSPVTIFQGLLVHAGHSYHTFAKEDTLSVAKEALQKVAHVQEILKSVGFNAKVLFFVKQVLIAPDFLRRYSHSISFGKFYRNR